MLADFYRMYKTLCEWGMDFEQSNLRVIQSNKPSLTIFLGKDGSVEDLYYESKCSSCICEIRPSSVPFYFFPTSNATPVKNLKPKHLKEIISFFAQGEVEEKDIYRTTYKKLIEENVDKMIQKEFNVEEKTCSDLFYNSVLFISGENFNKDFRNLIAKNHPRVDDLLKRIELMLKIDLISFLKQLEKYISDDSVYEAIVKAFFMNKTKVLFVSSDDRVLFERKELNAVMNDIFQFEEVKGTCLLTGEVLPLVKNFTDIGTLCVKPYSCNPDEYSNARYGLIGEDSIQVSIKATNQIKACIEKIIKDRTLSICRKYGDKTIRLFFYPDIELKAVVQENESYNFLKENGFLSSFSDQEEMRTVVKNFTKMIEKEKTAAAKNINVLFFIKISKGVGSVDVATQCTIQKIKSAYESWLNICENENNNKFGFDDFTKILFSKFSLNNQKKWVAKIGKRPVSLWIASYKFFVGETNEHFIDHMIKNVINESESILRDIGLKKDAKYYFDSKINYDRKFYDQIMTALWILTTRTKRKEEIMQTDHYLLGECYRLANDLHRLYSKQQKNSPAMGFGDMSYLTAMKGRPADSFAALGKNLCGIATKAEKEKADFGSSDLYGKLFFYREKLSQIKDIDSLLNKRWTPVEKAHFSLGYYTFRKYAKIEKNEENKEVNSEE